jgi:vacuolar-type H+-ATPase subunit F/Vma7
MKWVIPRSFPHSRLATPIHVTCSVARLIVHLVSSSLAQDSITGLLLAGIGHITDQQRKNFLVVDPSTSSSQYAVTHQPSNHPTNSGSAGTAAILHRDPNVRHRSCIPRLYRTKRHCHSSDQPTCTPILAPLSLYLPLMKPPRPRTQVADRIRPTVDRYQAAFPALLEIPSKEHPYGTSLHVVYTLHVRGMLMGLCWS